MFFKKINRLNNSLLIRLTILYAAAFTLLSAIGFLAFYYRIYTVAMNKLDSELYSDVRNYGELMDRDGIAGLYAAIADEAKFEEAEDGFYRLSDFAGRTLIATDISIWHRITEPDLLQRMQQAGSKYDYQILTSRGGELKARTITSILGPDLVLQIGESLDEVDDYMDIFLKLVSILISSLIVVSVLIGWLLARRATMDMQEVTATAEEISSGALHRRVQVDGRLSEIQRLGISFNRMLDRIHDLLKSMQEINDNIAHDLRSPLARIRGIAEMNLLNENSIDAYKEMAANTIEECDALIELINTMLEITEAEAGVNRTPPETFDLTRLVKEACQLFHPIAKGKDIDFRTSLPDVLPMRSDRKKLQRIVTNLLENAVKYSDNNKSVTITVSTPNNHIVITIEDNGMGISEKDMPHIFKRFYRCDQSRSQGGVGLGLSQVKAYAELVGGSVHVESVFKQGSCFTLTFPRSYSYPSNIIDS